MVSMKLLLSLLLAGGVATAAGAVTVAPDAGAFTLTNGLLQARIARSGEVLSLRFKGLELLGESQTRSNGYWSLPGVAFDAAMMKAGTNVLKLTVPAGPVTAGVEYDYLRLEVEERK
jgi:hypothetical protein